MRKKIVAGNWKMNMDYGQARSLFSDLKTIVYKDERVEVIIAPPAIYLSQFSTANISQIALSAQNCSTTTNGAFTGELSASMLASIKLPYCIIGHSERRQIFSETDEMVASKARMLVDNGLIPILCCGETLEERQSGKHFDLVNDQITKGLSQLSRDEVAMVVIAYEPVWAIGTGETASPEQAQEMHAFIRGMLLSAYDDGVATEVRILYGGSVKPANAKELFASPDIDGGLVGGASLNYESFKGIIEAAQ